MNTDYKGMRKEHRGKSGKSGMSRGQPMHCHDDGGDWMREPVVAEEGGRRAGARRAMKGGSARGEQAGGWEPRGDTSEKMTTANGETANWRGAERCGGRGVGRNQRGAANRTEGGNSASSTRTGGGGEEITTADTQDVDDSARREVGERNQHGEASACRWGTNGKHRAQGGGGITRRHEREEGQGPTARRMAWRGGVGG